MLGVTWILLLYAFGVWVGRTRRMPWMPWRRYGERKLETTATERPEVALTPQDLSIARDRLMRVPAFRHAPPEVQDRILRRQSQNAAQKLSGRTLI